MSECRLAMFSTRTNDAGPSNSSISVSCVVSDGDSTPWFARSKTPNSVATANHLSGSDGGGPPRAYRGVQGPMCRDATKQRSPFGRSKPLSSSWAGTSTWNAANFSRQFGMLPKDLVRNVEKLSGGRRIRQHPWPALVTFCLRRELDRRTNGRYDQDHENCHT